MSKNKLPDHIQDYLVEVEGSKEQFASRELLKAENENVDLKTDLSGKEIVLINKLAFNNKVLEDAGLDQVFKPFIYQYMRLKFSHDRKSREEFVNMNKNDNSDEFINKVSNMKSILDVRT